MQLNNIAVLLGFIMVGLFIFELLKGESSRR